MRVFIIIALLLAALSVVARAIRPAPAPPGATRLLWVSDDNPSRREQMDLFNRLNPDLVIQLDPDNFGMEKVIVQSLAGVGPDLFDCYGPDWLESYVRAGIAWDITDELKRAGVDVDQDVWPSARNLHVYEGRVYGLPNCSVDALWLNKAAFDEAGLPYPRHAPWTWQQFIPLAQRLTVRNADGRVVRYGFCYDFFAWKFFLFQFGGRIYSEDGTRCTLDAPEAIAAVQFMHDLIYKYRVSPSPQELEAMSQAGGWGSESIKLLASGRAATALGGRWWLCQLRSHPELRLGAVEAPHGPRRTGWGYGKATLINRHSPRRQEALRFMLHLAGPEYHQLDNHQADGIPPMIKYCDDESLVNPAFPHEDYHHVFRDVMFLGEAESTSPFVNAAVAGASIRRQMDLILRNRKDVAAGLRDAAREINADRDRRLQRDPALRARYEALVAGARP